jgi:hypothetical protein
VNGLEKPAVLGNMHQLNNSTETFTTAPQPISRNAVYVWDALAQIYGAAFTNQFGEKPNQFWNAKLSELSPSDIQFGLEQCQRSGNQFAPNLPQFLAYCTPPIVEDVYKNERETQMLLERRRSVQSTPEVRRAELAKMKADLVTFPKAQAT